DAPTAAPRRAVLYPAGGGDLHFRPSSIGVKQRQYQGEAVERLEHAKTLYPGWKVYLRWSPLRKHRKTARDETCFFRKSAGRPRPLRAALASEGKLNRKHTIGCTLPV